MSKKKLFDEDSDEDIDIKTENEYAKKYDNWREKEEIHKLEQKYGPKALKEDGAVSSDSEDESDGPPEVNEEMEEQFLKTLALLKTKDPRIYDPSFKCFDEEKEKETEKETNTKPFLTFDDSDDDDEDGEIFKVEKKAVIDDVRGNSQDCENDKEIKKSKKEGKIKDFLTGKAININKEVEKDLAPLKALWSDPKLNEGEAFLRDYILNKRYLDEGEVGDALDKVRDDLDLEADEQTVEEQSKFERAYNFRFEEPDEEYLKRFPRTMSSIRPKDDRRARKRADVRTRKEEEKQRKMEEIARLKALKLKEIQEKIAKIKEVTGNDDLAFEEEDIEGEFDPEEHDRRMRALFDERYYGRADRRKPEFPDLDDELEIENWDNYDVENKEVSAQEEDEPHCEDEDFNMDADYAPRQGRAGLLQEIQKTLGKKRRTRKRKSALARLLAAGAPTYLPAPAAGDPAAHGGPGDYSRFMDEYYAMDCEDVVGGDLPTRFKYRQVVPNDYGLTVEEILLADDKELTQWVPLKKIVKHRPESVEKGEVKTYQQRAADRRLKQKMLPSLFRDLPEEPELAVPVDEGNKKKKKKKKKNKGDAEKGDVAENGEVAKENVTDSQEEKVTIENDYETPKKKKKGRESEASYKEECDVTTVNEQKTEVNENAKERKRRKKKQRKVSNIEVPNTEKGNGGSNNKTNDDSTSNKQAPGESPKNKKDKQKPNGFTVESVTNKGPSNVQPIQDSSSKCLKQKTNVNSNKNGGNNLKRKLDSNIGCTSVPNKKKKHNNKNAEKTIVGKHKKDLKMKLTQKGKLRNKQNDKSSDNPLSKLSDERLKAYGLNPKKYRGFLKYKKF